MPTQTTSHAVQCPGCQFVGAELGIYSPAWYAEHERVHLAAFPDLDQVSRDNLADATRRALAA